MADAYELQVDEQVQKLIELNHQLTYFLITAAAVTMGFTANVLLGRKELAGVWAMGWILAAALTALGSAASALLALRHDISSFRLHVKYRYQRTDYASLSAAEKSHWDQLNELARRHRSRAFVLLIASFSLQGAFLIHSLAKPEDSAVHHYGEDSTMVYQRSGLFVAVLRNKVSGQAITIEIPIEGSLESGAPLTLNQAESVAREIAHLLRVRLSQ